MQQIKEISERIEEEIEDAEKYVKCAIKYKQYDKELSDAYYDLSLQEMRHSNILHDQGVRLIEEYKAEGKTIPVGMQAVYDYLHEKHIEKANNVKALQTAYHE